MPTVDMVRTGQNINRLRKQTGLSTADLQAALGLSSPRAIFKWQRGELPFAAGDAFLAEGLEEYDLYGEGVFWIAED